MGAGKPPSSGGGSSSDRYGGLGPPPPGVEAVVALVVDLGVALVQAAVAPLGPIQAYSLLQLVPHHPVVKVAVVPATVLAVAGMVVAVHLIVEVQATPLVAL